MRYEIILIKSTVSLLELFEERMKLTTEVAEYKIETGKKVLDPAREKLS